MKKNCFVILFLITFCMHLVAEPDYKDGNGTIISSITEKEIRKTIRKCEVDNIRIGDLLDEKNRDIYTDYNFDNKIGMLKDNDMIKVLEVCEIEYLDKSKDEWNNPAGELWFKILLGNKLGFICKSTGFLREYEDPYFENRYEIVEEITTTKKLVVRKMKQTVSVWENLNIRSNPGLENTKILYTIRPGQTDPVQTNVEVVAMTQEKESIDGESDFWLKIKYKNYEGWIFGGYASIERGGPKYYIPENIVISDLSGYGY